VSGRSAPTVSIGLPVYNGEAQLSRSIESLLAQTYGDFELVISDNHSTDATEPMCRDFAARDRRIRYVRSEKNRGVAWNYTRAFELSTGRYFKWASSNDFHAPTFLSRCLAVLESGPGVALAYTKTRIIDGGGAAVRDYEDNLDLPWPEAPRRFREFLRRVGLCNALYGLMRSDTVRRTGKLGDFPGSDIVFLGELSLHGTFVEVPEVLFHRRYDDSSVLHNATRESWQDFFDPMRRGEFVMRTWRHQGEYLLADLRAPLSLADKARVAGTIARVCIAVRNQLARELAGAVRRSMLAALPRKRL
jgi:glycosyltransferase involved in cell wall biosynthesis